MAEQMTLEQVLELGYRAGFISACNWPASASQDADSPAFASELRGFIERHTPILSHLDQPAQAVDVCDLCHELYAMAQGQQPISDAVTAMELRLTRAISGEKAGPGDGWISIEERRPERNKAAIYWHKSEFGGFATIADEWRDEHHLQYATHWMPYVAPASPAPDKEGQS